MKGITYHKLGEYLIMIDILSPFLVLSIKSQLSPRAGFRLMIMLFLDRVPDISQVKRMGKYDNTLGRLEQGSLITHQCFTVNPVLYQVKLTIWTRAH